MELWNKRGNRFPRSRGSEELMEFLSATLQPGTGVEGEWVRKNNTLYLFDVTHKPVDTAQTEHRSFTSQEARDLVEAESSLSGKLSQLVVTEENKDTLTELHESQQLSTITILDAITYCHPPNPTEASKEILLLPPDDWRMELKLNGDRVVAIRQPSDGLHAMDLRRVANETRHTILGSLVDMWDHPQIKLMPFVDTNFPQVYEQWREVPEAEGVVVKRRNSVYVGGSRAAITVPTWVKRRYDWDE